MKKVLIVGTTGVAAAIAKVLANAASSDTPESPGGIDANSDKPQNPSNNSVSATDGDLDVSKPADFEIDEVCRMCGNLLTGTEQDTWGNCCDGCKALN